MAAEAPDYDLPTIEAVSSLAEDLHAKIDAVVLHAAPVDPAVLFAILCGIFGVVIFLLVNLLSGHGSSSGKKVVVVGPCNSGKTVLYHQLVNGEAPAEGTVASMQENEGICHVLNDKKREVCSAKVVDIPGHERLRHKLEAHLKEAKAVVFVLDAVDITPHRVEAAEELFEVLTHPQISRRRVRANNSPCGHLCRHCFACMLQCWMLEADESTARTRDNAQQSGVQVPILLACNKMDLETQVCRRSQL